MKIVFLLCLLAMAIMAYRRLRRRHFPGPIEGSGPDGRCAWQINHRPRSSDVMIRWRCAKCMADGVTIDGHPPQTCKKPVDAPVE